MEAELGEVAQNDHWELALFNGESHSGARLVGPNGDLSFSVAISMKSLLIDDRILIQGEGFPGGSDNKESTCNMGGLGSIDSWVGKIPWRRAWQPTPVFWSWKSYGQKENIGLCYSPLGHKESDMHEATERKRSTQ